MSPAPQRSALGLRAGDEVQAIDGHKVLNWNELREFIATSGGRDDKGRPRTVFTIERGGKVLDIVLFPQLGGDEKIRQVGISPAFALIVFKVERGSPAGKAGIEAGDEILRLDGIPMSNDMPLGEYLDANRARPISALLRRAGHEISLPIPARSAAGPDADFGLTFSAGLHMIYPSPLVQIRDQVAMTFRTLGSLLNPHSDIGLSKLAGPIGIVHMFNIEVENGLRAVFGFTILVNVNLAIFNLMPIPVLDGGQMLFATIGRLRRRALPTNFIMATQSVFMVLLFSMVIYVSYFNVRRWARDLQSDRAESAAVQPK